MPSNGVLCCQEHIIVELSFSVGWDVPLHNAVPFLMSWICFEHLACFSAAAAVAHMSSVHVMSLLQKLCHVIQPSRQLSCVSAG